MTITTTDTALLRLLQLSSAALPVGGYSFSQGLEYAIDSGWLKNAEQVAEWLSLQLSESLARVDLPLLLRLHRAALNGDENRSNVTSLSHWNSYTLACRETAELRLTDTAMGAALKRLLDNLELPCFESGFEESGELSFVTAFAMAAAHWQIEARACCHGYLWSWLENQVAAATKLVPLGQTTAQQLLGQLLQQFPAAIDRALTIADDQIGASLPALAMASCWHETQYSRLFRS